jgi:uncharacterized protein
MSALKEILEKIKDNKTFLENEFGVKDIAVFGSYAKGNFTDESDLDIFVELSSIGLTFDNFMELKFFLENLFGLKIDLSIKDSIRSELRDQVYREAIHV